MIVNCPKCNKEFENIGKWSIKKFCSRKCANSRIFSQESIEKKRSAAIANFNFNTLNGKKSNPSLWSEETRNKWRESLRKTYKEKYERKSFNELGIDGKRRRVIEEQQEKCNKCKLSEWFDKKLTLEIEHKDGNKKNNDRDNLEALCPNCHSLTKTWRGRNKQNKSVSDEYLILCLKETTNIRQALIKADLSPRAGNYRRAKRLLEEIQ